MHNSDRTMSSELISRVQSYLRISASQRYSAVALPPFTVFFHPIDTFHHFNYAIPNEPVQGDHLAILAKLKAEFLDKERTPRFEFIEEYAPHLVHELRRANFVEESRQQLMVCTPATYAAPVAPPGLSIRQLTNTTPPDDILVYLNTQRKGFDPSNTRSATPEEAAQFVGELRTIAPFLARLDGQPAGVAAFTLPDNGVTEILAVATLAPLRRRGIATALAGAAVQTAFAEGATLACLTAADKQAGRVYERVGFRPCATMLAYSLSAEQRS
jgi:GNAT superfamily N-acetyltransferase